MDAFGAQGLDEAGAWQLGEGLWLVAEHVEVIGVARAALIHAGRLDAVDVV